MDLVLFLAQVFVISLSGALQPGPVTATAIAIGSRRPHAGALIAIGHGIIEFPLMVLLLFGIDEIIRSNTAKVLIGFVGGIILLVMAVQMFKSTKSTTESAGSASKHSPVLAGVLLTATNPHLLIWWATIGLTLASKARGFGVLAFALFTIVHWLCDFLWLEILSMASCKGSTLIGAKSYRIALYICAVAILLFGIYFITDSVLFYNKL